MSSSLLQTKLYIPLTRVDLVPRPHLIERLNAGLRKSDGFVCKLTLVSAPAGFGKTTLVSDWLQQADLSAAWLSLDENDTDLSQFLAYFITALQQIEADMGQIVQNLLQFPQLPSLETLVTTLINDLVAFPQAFVLVLDDYHLIDSQPIHQVLTFLLDHLPPQMHLVIVTRADPPLPLSRLRARGQMAEIREDDLRFTIEETATFLNVIMGLSLAKKDVQVLETRTEGWIVGLQLAALSIQGRADQHSFVTAFAGSHHYIVDYLVDEVLSRQPDEIRQFLLKTSILERLNGPLCDATLTYGETFSRQPFANSQAVLEHLHQANLFITPLDDQRQWYRYHHLFADLLRFRLEQSQPELLPRLHRRAADWYYQQNMTDDAIRHALAAADFEFVAQLLEQVAPRMIQQTELAQLLAWVNQLSEEYLQSQPLLALYLVWALIFSGQPAQAIARLEMTETRLQQSDPGESHPAHSHVAAIRAYLAREVGELSQSITLSQQALAGLPASESLLRAMVALNQAIALDLCGDLVPAEKILADVIATGRSPILIANTLSGIYLKSRIHRTLGQLQYARQVCREGIALVEEMGWHSVPSVGFLYVALGEVLREQNHLTEAAEYLVKGIELGQAGAHPHIMVIGHVWLAWVRQTQGDQTAADAAIEGGRRVALTHQISRFWPIPVVDAYQSRLWLAQGNIEAATNWAKESGLNVAGIDEIELNFLHEGEHLTWARVLLAQDNPIATIKLLQRLLAEAEAGQRMGSAIEIQLLLALAYQAQGKRKQALSALEQALTLAQPEGYYRLFVDEGAPIAALLQEAIIHNITPAYAGKLLATVKTELQMRPEPEEMSPKPSPRLDSPPTPQLIDPLSERELEVLNLVAEGLSNREIAEELVLALGTVKRHTNNIYSKLQARSRIEAVAKARALRLL